MKLWVANQPASSRSSMVSLAPFSAIASDEAMIIAAPVIALAMTGLSVLLVLMANQSRRQKMASTGTPKWRGNLNAMTVDGT